MKPMLYNSNNTGIKSPVINLEGINKDLISERISCDDIQTLQNSNFLYYKNIPILNNAAPNPKIVLFETPCSYSAILNEIRIEYIANVAGTFQQSINLHCVHYSRARELTENFIYLNLLTTPAGSEGNPRYAVSLNQFLFQRDILYIDISNFDSTVTKELHISCRVFHIPTKGIKI